MSSLEVWNEFEHDPRVAANAGLRASDRDRGVFESLLADAYAEGRLTRAEYDERSDVAMSSRTLGDLMPLLSDLPISSAPCANVAGAYLPIASAPRTAVAGAALRAYHRDRRHALWALLSASLICWVVWFASGFGPGGWDPDHPWPLYVMLGTGLNAGRVIWQKNEILEEEIRRLEKKERKALEKRNQSGD